MHNMIKFSKYQAAGNAYIIIHTANHLLSAVEAKRICDPIFGLGGDGVICWQKIPEGANVFIFNPDGSQAEKSGNGLRIFADFYFNHVSASPEYFTIQCTNSQVKASRLNDGSILLEMGRVVSQFEHKGLDESKFFPGGFALVTDLGTISGFPVDIGNPHFVVLQDRISADFARQWGPLIENHTTFPNRTNVQFAKIIDQKTITAEIWERGAGYTLSSGSSSCAIVAVANQLGKCDAKVTVKMPGGDLTVHMLQDKSVSLVGPVSKTVDGVFYTD